MYKNQVMKFKLKGWFEYGLSNETNQCFTLILRSATLRKQQEFLIKH